MYFIKEFVFFEWNSALFSFCWQPEVQECSLYLNVGPWDFNFFCSLKLSQAKEADKVELLKCLQYKSWAAARSIHPLNKRQRSHSIPEAKGSWSPAWTLLCCPALSELCLSHQVWAVSLCEPWYRSTYSFYEYAKSKTAHNQQIKDAVLGNTDSFSRLLVF